MIRMGKKPTYKEPLTLIVVFICYSMIARLCLRQQFPLFSAFVGNRDSCRNHSDRKTRKSDARHAIPSYLCHVERNERVSGGINKIK